MNHSGPARPRSTYPTPGELENHRLKSAHLVGRNMCSLEGKWKYTVIKWEVITFFFNVKKWRVARLPTQGPGLYYIVSICSICSFFDAWENEQTPISNWSLQRRHVKKKSHLAEMVGANTVGTCKWRFARRVIKARRLVPADRFLVCL